MNRAIVVSMFLASASLAVACDKSGADTRNQVNEAQQQANQQIGRANAQATQAQAEANQKIAAAQADFLQTREDYRHKMQINLDALDKRIGDLEATQRAAAPKAKTDLHSALRELHTQHDSFVRDFRTLDDSTMDTFDAAKVRLDKEWMDLKAAVDKMS
jgi:hypothetical protein